MGTPNAPYNGIEYIPAGATPQPAFIWHAGQWTYNQYGGLPANAEPPVQAGYFRMLAAPPIPRSVPGGRTVITVTTDYGNTGQEFAGNVQAPMIPTAGNPAGSCAR